MFNFFISADNEKKLVAKLRLALAGSPCGGLLRGYTP